MQLTDMDLECERELESLEQNKQLPSLSLQPHQQRPAHARLIGAIAARDAIQNVNIADATKRDALLCGGKKDSFYGPTFAVEFSEKFGETFAA